MARNPYRSWRSPALRPRFGRPPGRRRPPLDSIEIERHVFGIVTPLDLERVIRAGELERCPLLPNQDAAFHAVALGRLGGKAMAAVLTAEQKQAIASKAGKVGGKRRAEVLTAQRRREIASQGRLKLKAEAK